MSILKVEVVQEVALYSWENFIADFGGYLGLLLGGSIPGLIEMLQSAFVRLRKILGGKIKKRQNAKSGSK